MPTICICRGWLGWRRATNSIRSDESSTTTLLELGNALLSGSEDAKFHSSSSVDACTCVSPIAAGVDALFVAAANGLGPRELADIKAAKGSAVTEEEAVVVCCCCLAGCGGCGGCEKPGAEADTCDCGREELSEDRIS